MEERTVDRIGSQVHRSGPARAYGYSRFDRRRDRWLAASFNSRRPLPAPNRRCGGGCWWSSLLLCSTCTRCCRARLPDTTVISTSSRSMVCVMAPMTERGGGRRPRSERRARLWTVARQGTVIRYVYDFGDDWVHRV